MGGRIKTSADYCLLADKRKFIWLGPLPTTTKYNTKWQCLYNHVWEASYNAVQMGNGCPACSNHVSKTQNDYHQLAQNHEILWVGDFPTTTHSKTRWRCYANHEWDSAYTTIQAGKGCPECHYIKIGDKFRLSVLKYEQTAKLHGFRWIGTHVNNNKQKTSWQCSKGHEWQASYNSVSRGQGCPKCARIRVSEAMTLTPNDYNELAKQMGLKWVGTPVQDSKSRTQWECTKGHILDRSYGSVYRSLTKGNVICPMCRDFVNGVRVSVPQRLLHNIIGGEINLRVGRYSIDIALQSYEYKIAIEYDCWYWHKNTSQHDIKKNNYLMTNGWRVLRVKASELIPTLDQLNTAIDYLISGKRYIEIILSDWKG